jgi:hypothetical protein
MQPSVRAMMMVLGRLFMPKVQTSLPSGAKHTCSGILAVGLELMILATHEVESWLSWHMWELAAATFCTFQNAT